MTLSSPSEAARSVDARPVAARFAAVTGSVTGRDHLRARRDGQDGFAEVATADVSAVIVTDGCSSGRASEIGARLGAAWLAASVAETFAASTDAERNAKRVTSTLVERLSELARSLSRSSAVVDATVTADMLLFGFLVAVVARNAVVVFGVGDGVAWVDGVTTVIDPGPDNAPPYPAYALLGAAIEPRVLHVGDAGATSVVAVATDGAAELAGGALDGLVCDDALLRNPSLLRKRLLALSERSRLWDDTTVGILRRLP